MLGIQRLVFFLLTLVCLVRTNELIGRTVCLQDVLAFYNADRACDFSKAVFTKNFKASQQMCLVKCTLKKFTPKLEKDETYELEELQINFLNTFFHFTMMKPCDDYYNDDVYLTVTCDERGFYDRRIGESCKNESICNASNPYSTCNTSNGVCECKKGYMYIAQLNTCFPERLSIGDKCNLNEPCMEDTEIGFCRQTEGGKECSLLSETDNTHSSQHAGFQTNSLPIPTEIPSVDIPETTLTYSSRQSFQTNSMPNLTKALSAEISATSLTYSSKEMAKNRDLPVGIIVGAAAAGFVSGIIVCGIVCIILSRCKKATSTKRSVEFAATVDNYGFEVAATSAGKSEQRTVQVTEESSRSDVNQKGGTVPLDDIYNHLHETSGMPGIQPEYDHVPCNDTDDETYHHLNLGNTKNVNTVTRADLENHYN